jgi:hypothetical protein
MKKDMNKKTKKIIISLIPVLALSLLLLCQSVEAHTYASLSWEAPTTNTDGSALNDLAGYKIYYGETSVASGSCPSGYPSGNTITTGTTTRSYNFNNILTPGHTYYFQVTAYDTSGNESACSVTPGQVSKAITFSCDFNSDSNVNIFDYTAFVSSFGQSGSDISADANRDGTVNIFDYTIFAGDFGKSF